jgi:hypothetical protein
MRAGWLVFLVACGGGQVTAGAAPAPSATVAGPTGPAVASSAVPPVPPVPALPAPSATAMEPATAGDVVLIGEIAGTPKFDPKSTLDGAKADLLECYRKARAVHPSLRGKVTLRIVVNEGGHAVNVEAEPGGTANDPALVACIADALRSNVTFQKPGGSATVIAPLVFHPS